MTGQKRWTVNAIKDANRAAGFHWFDPGTMKSFGTRVLPSVYQGPGGVYFVTEDKDYHDKRLHSVRSFDPATGNVKTVGHVASMTREQAIALAPNKAAAGAEQDATETAQEFAPVSVLEQFLLDLHTHGRPDATRADALALMRLARRHHKAAERECNHGGDHTTKIQAEIEPIGLRVGAAGFHFSGDPRGCTVKIVFKDGATNDFGSEGWCVPTGEGD